MSTSLLATPSWVRSIPYSLPTALWLAFNSLVILTAEALTCLKHRDVTSGVGILWLLLGKCCLQPTNVFHCCMCLTPDTRPLTSHISPIL